MAVDLDTIAGRPSKVAGDETPPAPGRDPDASYQRFREVEELLEFAAEKGKLDPPDLADRIKDLKQPFVSRSQTPSDEADLEKLYDELAPLIAPVTSDTFRATSEKYGVPRPWWTAWLLGPRSHSIGRNFFRQLAGVGVLLVAILFFHQYLKIQIELIGDSAPPWQRITIGILSFAGPFIYGTLGALVYLYKTLNDYYNERIFDPKKLPTDWFRLFMGGIAGGVLVLFIQSLPEETGKTVEVVAAAVGFLAGYSVEFFYQTLDRIIQAILPKVSVSGLKPPVPSSTPKQQLAENLVKRLLEAKDEKDKDAIRRLIEKLS